MTLTLGKTFRRQAGLVGRWLLVFLIFFLIARWLRHSLPELSAAKLDLSLPWLTTSVILLSGYLIGSALIWHYLTLILDIAIPRRQAVAAWFYSQLFKYLPGKIFLYLARLHFYVRESRSGGRVSLGVAIELIAVVSATMIVALVSLFASQFKGSPLSAAGGLGLLIVLIALLHPRILNWVIRLTAGMLRRPPFMLTVSHGQMLRFVGLHTLNWVLLGVAVFAMVRSFYPLPPDAILPLSGAFAMATLIGMAAVFAPAGLGVREGMLAVLLARLMPDGIAVVTALTTRVWLSLVELMCVGIITVMAGSRHRPTRQEMDALRRIESSA